MDTKLPWGIVASLEAIFNKDLNTAFFRSPNYIAPQNLNVAGYPDNRPIYGSTVQTRHINTINSAGFLYRTDQLRLFLLSLIMVSKVITLHSPLS